MDLVAAIFAIAFAAFCVWLGVRVVNRRERWAKWTGLVLIVALVLYPLSSGPATWIVIKAGAPSWLLKLYEPSHFVVKHGPDCLQDNYSDWHIWWIESAGGEYGVSTDPEPVPAERVNPPAPTPDAPADSN